MAIYRVIYRGDNTVRQCKSAREVSIFMLGRYIHAYIVVKSDESGDRVVSFHSADINNIEERLETA